MPTKPITLFEYETWPFEWTRADLARIERLNAALGDEALRLTVKGGQRVVQATQYVGVVRLGQHTIQVLPKIHAAGVTDRNTQARQATRNFLHLLAEAGHVTVREHAVAPLLQRDSDWFEILTRLFATHLKDEWLRGAHRCYVTIDDELGVLKGRWRVAEQVRRPARDHRFDVTYDEFTADTPLNRVFRYVVERLWRVSRDAANRRLLGELRFAWYHRIVPLLQEYFYNDGERLRAVLGDLFMEPVKVDKAVFDATPGFLDGDATRWEVRTLEGDAFKKALRTIAETLG